MLHKDNYYRNKKWLAAARGQDCTLRFIGCNRNPETTVAAHSPFKEHGGGMGIKAPDDKIVFACSVCHDILDGRRKSPYSRGRIKLVFNLANQITLEIIKGEGL